MSLQQIMNLRGCWSIAVYLEDEDSSWSRAQKKARRAWNTRFYIGGEWTSATNRTSLARSLLISTRRSGTLYNRRCLFFSRARGGQPRLLFGFSPPPVLQQHRFTFFFPLPKSREDRFKAIVSEFSRTCKSYFWIIQVSFKFSTSRWGPDKLWKLVYLISTKL